MKDPFVADASLALAWVSPSQATDVTNSLLIAIGLGRPFVVPVLWTFEIANALVILGRRGNLTPAQCSNARTFYASLRPTVDEEGLDKVLSRISEIADSNALTVYDAAYLELAIRRRLPLASRNSALNKAAKANGIETLI